MKSILSQMKSTLKKWVEIKSVKGATENGAPFGADINKMLNVALEDASNLGFEVKNYSGYIGEVVYGNGSEDNAVAVLCHLDVVPEGDIKLWKTPPFCLVEEGDYLYGRGVLDDKAPAVACLYALKSLKDEGFIPSKKIKLIFGLDEESGWGCIEHYNKVSKMPSVGFSPDGSFPVIYAEKGILHAKFKFNKNSIIEILQGGDRANVVCDKVKVKLNGKRTVNFKGVCAHASTPKKGDNAIKKALKYLVKKGLFLESDNENLFSGRLFEKIYDESGALTFSPNVINTSKDEIEIVVDVRYPVHYTFEEIEKVLRKVGDFEVISHHKPLYADKNGALVKTLLKVYETNSKKSGTPTVTGGGTYARALKHGVAFGPSESEDTCHMPNERIKISTFELCYKVYKDAIYELSK